MGWDGVDNSAPGGWSQLVVNKHGDNNDYYEDNQGQTGYQIKLILKQNKHFKHKTIMHTHYSKLRVQQALTGWFLTARLL